MPPPAGLSRDSSAGVVSSDQRYEVRSLLGEGGSGRVFRAFDRVRGLDVALKTLRKVDPEDAYRLKKEFRTLVDVTHPHLIRLYDLVATAEDCFFTMELVEGPNLLDWVWQRTPPKPGEAVSAETLRRLRSAITQLAHGVEALHELGMLHRDIKPSNVLVSLDERVLVTDFGLVSQLAPVSERGTGVGAIVGTLHYMAPEQSWGQTLSPAADWYSVGVILYEALTGRLPYKNTDRRLLAEKRASLGPPPNLPPGTPADIDELTRDLLDANPSRRPAFEDIVRRLGDGDAVSSVRRSRRGFVGRGPELEWLERMHGVARSGGTAFAQISAPPGFGKTALVERFLSTIESSTSTVVLRGRCHFREYVLFKALDGVVDDLSRHLAELPPSELAEIVPHDTTALLQVFPVLGRLEGLTDFQTPAVAAYDFRLRHRAFVALRNLLRRVAGRRRLVLWIDDLQWADSDSVVFLRLLQGSTGLGGLMTVYASRTGEQVESRMKSLLSSSARGHVLESIELKPMGADEARALVEELVPMANPEQVHAIVRATAGVPLLVHGLCGPLFMGAVGHSVELPTFEQLVSLRIEGLPDSAREVLSIICVAGDAVEQRLIFMVSSANAESSLWRLQELTLIRQIAKRERVRWEPTHDKIREAVAALLTSEQRATLHARVAVALQTISDPDPHDLLEHLLAGGKAEQAIEQALLAASSADRRAAFEMSASLYKRVLEIGTQVEKPWRLRASLGTALINAGLAREGALQLMRAADNLTRENPGDLEIVRLRATAGERLLFSGFSTEGLELMHSALRALSAPFARSSAGGILRGAMHMPRAAWAKRQWLARTKRAEPSARAVSATEALRLQVVWSAGFALAWNDPMRAVELHVRHSTLAYATMHSGHIARSKSVEAVMLAMRGGAARLEKAIERQAEAQRLAEQSGDPSVQTFIALYSAVLEFFMGRWQHAFLLAERTVELCYTKGIGVVPEMGLAQWMCLASLAYMGDVSEIRSRLPEYLMTAEARHDRRSMCIFRLGWINCVWLCGDLPQEAAAQAADAFAAFSESKFDNIHYLHLIGRTNIELYRGRRRDAWQFVRQSWRGLKGSFLLGMVTVHCEMYDSRGRAALAYAHQLRAEGADYRATMKDLRACAKALSSNALPSAQPLAAVLQAGIASLEERRSDTRALLERAVVGFDRLDMAMHAAACRHRLASMIALPERVDLEREANDWFAAQGVVRPALLADVLVPMQPAKGAAVAGSALGTSCYADGV